jgi:hypothetical protein
MAKQRMGLGKLGGEDLCMMRKFRWLFFIDEVCDDGTSALPPDKAARPSLSFKEIEAQHLNETIYFPGKPDWKPINLTLYDLKSNKNPIFQWLKQIYEPCEDKGTWRAPAPGAFKRTGRLKMYSGCGDVMEEWVYSNIWPNNIEWGDLDMSNQDVVTVEMTLRYDRAYAEDCSNNGSSFTGDINPGGGAGLA